MSHDLILVRKVDALIVVQVSALDLFEVKGEQFVQFVLQFDVAVERDAGIADAWDDLKLPARLHHNLIAKCRSKRIVSDGLNEGDGGLRLFKIRRVNDGHAGGEIRR